MQASASSTDGTGAAMDAEGPEAGSDLKGKPEAEFSVKHPYPCYLILQGRAFIPSEQAIESKKTGEALPWSRLDLA
jgi:hypothetical protein